MDPATLLLLLDSALTVVEKLSPKVAEMFSNGDITAEQQSALAKRLDALRNNDAFSGPEWEVK